MSYWQEVEGGVRLADHGSWLIWCTCKEVGISRPPPRGVEVVQQESEAGVAAEEGGEAGTSSPVGMSASPGNPTIQTIALDDRVLDVAVQAREEMGAGFVEDCAEAMLDGTVFPPIVLVADGERYLVADGFHQVDGGQGGRPYHDPG